MIILAIDPGRTTGVCAMRVFRDRSGFEVLTALEIPWETRLEFLEALIDGTFFSHEEPQPPEAVVVETFRLRQGRALQQAGSDFPSSQIIGSIQAFLWMDREPKTLQGTFEGVTFGPELLPTRKVWGLDRLHFQEPAIMSGVAIEAQDHSLVAGSPHKQDAYRHARFFYIMQVRSQHPFMTKE